MPEYIIEGRGKDSGRKRRRKYSGANEAAVRRQALRDGTEPDTVTLVEATYLTREVAGVSHKNADNTSRQRLIERCRVWDELLLTHETDNRYDKHAVRVTRRDGLQIGYVPADLAKWLMEWVKADCGCRYSAHIAAIVESRGQKPILLVDMFLVVSVSDVAQEAIDTLLETIRHKVKGIPSRLDLTPTREVAIGKKISPIGGGRKCTGSARRRGWARMPDRADTAGGCAGCVNRTWCARLSVDH